MADSPLPKTGREAVVQLLWGTIIFALGFEGVVKTVEGELLVGISCIIAALSLSLVLVYRAQIADFIGRNMTSFLVGLAIVGALLLGVALGALFFRGSSLLTARPSTGRLVWNFDDPTKAKTDFILAMGATTPNEVRIAGIQAVGKNTSNDPVTQFKGYIRVDNTNKTDPFYILAGEADSTKLRGPFDLLIPTLPEETYGIPGLADFRITTFDKVFFEQGKDGVPAEQFVKDHVPFTLVLEYDGLKVERHFSKKAIEEQIARFEQFANPANSALAPRVVRKASAAPSRMPADFPPLLQEQQNVGQPKADPGEHSK